VNRTILIRLLGAILACFGFASSGQGQADQDATQLAEQYRQIVRLIARKNYDEAIKQGRELLDRTNNYDHVFQRIVEAARAANKLDQARVLFGSLLQASPPNPKGHYGLGLVYSELKDDAAAIASYKQCLQELPEYPPPLLELVNIYRRKGNIAEVKPYLGSLLATRPDSPTAHLGMGWYYSSVGDVESAVKQMDAALSANPKLTEACYYKAFILGFAERSEESLKIIRQCLPAIEADLNEEQRKPFLSITARNHLRLGDYPEAFKNYDQLLKIAQGMEDKLYEEGTLGFLASMYALQGDYTRSILTFKQALAVAKESDSQGGVYDSGRHLGNIGQIYFKLGDLLMARHYYELGLEVARNAGDFRGQANIFSYLGELMAAQNELGQALTYYKQALEAEEKRPGITPRSFYYSVLSTLYLRAGDYQKAKETIDQALKNARELKTRLVELQLLNDLGELHLRLNEPELALKVYRESLQSNAGLDNPSYAWMAHAGLATAYQRLGQLDQARTHYVKAIEIMEGVRSKLVGADDKAGFYQNKVEVYKNLIAVLLKLGEKRHEQELASEAFHVSESARARAFSDLLAEAQVNLEQNLEADLLKRQHEIEASMSKLNAQLINERVKEPAIQDKGKIKRLEEDLSKADVEWSNWLRELRRRNLRYADLKYPEPLTLERAQRMLADHSLVLAYSLGERESFLFAVSRDGYRVAKLPSSSDIGEGVEKLIAAITARGGASLEKYRAQAVKLYEDLIQPAGELLAGKRELIILADDALHRLPFETLISTSIAALPTADRSDHRKWPYLISQFSISYAPSVSALASLRDYHKETGAPQKDFIAYANPNYDQQNTLALAAFLRSADDGQQLKLRRLLNSRGEVEEIAKLFAKNQTDLYFENSASEENVKAKDRLSQYRIVHFSAHGLVNEKRPRFSGIVLSLPKVDNEGIPLSEEDGLLSAYEIFDLKLNADLVVLSACQTGMGKEIKGEGMMGLMRAFMYAGTPSVVVSLWNVNDRSAADLMIRFYKNLWKPGSEKLNKAEALRKAQLEIIEMGSKPYHWAPFILVGKS
jgi:CHAT domain-containing protein/tetratricopeptide (TPR) repeat protein